MKINNHDYKPFASAFEATGDIIHAIEWRGGTLLDVIRKPAAFPKN